MQTLLPLLPPREEMVAAMLRCDSAYDGVFFTAVRTTGIFCRPTCTARKPRPSNVDFYATAGEAEAAGFRACLRCRPQHRPGEVPGWLRPVLEALEAAPDRCWSQADLAAFGVAPARARAWFREHYDTTFADYVRTRRLGRALLRLQAGDSIDGVALDAGYDSVSGFRDAFRKRFGIPPGRSGGQRVLHYRRIATPLGPMLAMAEPAGLVLLEFCDRPALPGELEDLRVRHGYLAVPGAHPHLDRIEQELAAYFAGRLETFGVPLHAPGSAFDTAVWTALRRIPPGTTCSYADLARAIGRPTAVRAVAGANGRNRLALVIPCHRVIGADGGLGGYGGGKARKAFLLRLEASRVDRAAAPIPELAA